MSTDPNLREGQAFSPPNPSFPAVEPPLAAEPGVFDDTFDTLELLREAANASVDVLSTTVYVPSGAIRVECTGNIAARDLQRWNRKAQPPAARKSNNPAAYDVDQRVLYTTVLVETAEKIEVRRPDGTWRAVEDTDHNLLTFKDTALLSSFGVLDSSAAIKKLWARDSDLVKVGIAILTGAGWAEGQTGAEEDEDGDPTG